MGGKCNAEYHPWSGGIEFCEAIEGDTVTSINFGSPGVDGSWQIIVSGNNLSFQRREGGVWVEKMAATP